MFCIHDGALIHGPATASEPAFDVRVQHDRPRYARGSRVVLVAAHGAGAPTVSRWPASALGERAPASYSAWASLGAAVPLPGVPGICPLPCRFRKAMTTSWCSKAKVTSAITKDVTRLRRR